MSATSALLVLDTSESMASGLRIQRLQRALDGFRAEVASEEELEIALFSSSGVSLPLAPAAAFVVPALEAGGTLELGAALEQALEAAAGFVKQSRSAGRPFRKPVVVVVSAGTPSGPAWAKAARLARAAEATGRALVLAVGVGPSVDLHLLGDCSPSDAPAHRVLPAELPAFFEWLAAKLRGEARALPGSGSGSGGGGGSPAEARVAMRAPPHGRC